jgi:hypothetical protein
MIEAQKETPASVLLDHANAPKRWLARLLVLLLAVALTLIAVVPFFFMGQSEDGRASGLRMPTTHDMFLHFDQMRSFYAGLKAGEVYPRWEAETNRGFGAPTTSYYPPGVYYLTSACFALAGDWTKALLGAHLLMMLGAALALYWYARQHLRRAAAAAAMLVYVLGPYHLLDQYQRGALAELLGFIWMPLMMGAGERLIEKGKGQKAKGKNVGGEDGRAGVRRGDEQARGWGSSGEVEEAGLRRPRFGDGRLSYYLVWVGLLAVSYGGFIWSHPPTAYQFSLGYVVVMGVLAMVRREWGGLVRVGVGLGLGVGLAAAYILPAVLEQNLIHKDYILSSWPYHNTYVFVHDIFNARNFVDFYRQINALWVLGLVFTILCGVTLLLAGNDPSTPPADGEARGLRRFFAFFERDGLLSAELKQRVLMWMMLGLFVSFMMHKISKPIGQHIPKIDIGIFTWRMLAMTTLVTALLAGACWQAASNALRQQRKRLTVAFATLSLSIMIGGAAFSLLAVCLPMVKAPLFVPEPEHMNNATLPATAPGDPEELPDEVPPAELAEDNGQVVVEKWEPEQRIVHIELTEPDQLWIRAFNFPGWTATVDGKSAEITTGEDLGDIQINLPAGHHDVRLDFLDTPIRRNAERVTLITFMMVIGMAATSLLYRRNRPHPAQ